jgi:uncharacterized protein (DUF1330 family)
MLCNGKKYCLNASEFRSTDLFGDGTSMTVYVIIHTTVDDTETHHREIVPKIMRAVERHGGKRIALGHGEQLRVHEGEPPNANRVVIHEFPDHESVEHWVEDVKANREQLHTLGDLTIISVPGI